MRAAQVFEDLTLRIGELDPPRPGRGGVLVRVRAAGVCGTDLHITSGMHRPDRYPMTLGHEMAGIVEAVGQDVENVKEGDHVAVYNKLFCGLCEQCLSGHQNLCDRDPRQLGLNVDGGTRITSSSPRRTRCGCLTRLTSVRQRFSRAQGLPRYTWLAYRAYDSARRRSSTGSVGSGSCSYRF